MQSGHGVFCADYNCGDLATADVHQVGEWTIKGSAGKTVEGSDTPYPWQSEFLTPLERTEDGNLRCTRCFAEFDGNAAQTPQPNLSSGKDSELDSPAQRATDFVSRWLLESSAFHVGLSDGNTEPDYNDLVARLTAYAQMVEGLAEAAQEVLNSGVELDDKRMSYVVMQVDRETLNQVRTALAAFKAWKELK